MIKCLAAFAPADGLLRTSVPAKLRLLLAKLRTSCDWARGLEVN